MSNNDDIDRGVCILSFDNGKVGTYSQLLILKDYMKRLAAELNLGEDDIHPADYFELVGGVGFGGLVAFMLGQLRMTINQAIQALLAVVSAVFPGNVDTRESPETNMQSLKAAIGDLLRARGLSVDAKLYDKGRSPVKCKVALFAATSADVSHIKVLRTYPHRGTSINATVLEALCATIASPTLFSPIKIGLALREQFFVGGPLGANNPTRELLKEAVVIFGEDKRVAQIISLGAGKYALPIESTDPEAFASRLLKSLTTDCETVAAELSTRLFNVDAYVRLNVSYELEGDKLDDWRNIATIASQTMTYLEDSRVGRSLEISLQYLQNKIGTATLAQINQSSNAKVPVKIAPAVSPYFVARQKEWHKLVHHLVDVPPLAQKVFAITGMAGCGKTQLVSYFLQEKGSRYGHIVFVDASSSYTIKADLQAWAQSLGNGHEQDVWEDALRILASGLDEGRWILILDNADNPALDLVPFLPKCYNGAVIVTSRNRNVGDLANSYHLELGEMATDEAFSTLMRATHRQEPLPTEEMDSANALMKMLGNLAVALVQAGTYCFQLSSDARETFTFTQYASLFSIQRAELINRAESSSLDDYQLSAYTAFDVSYKAIPELAKHFFHFLSYFNHSSIPLLAFPTAIEYAFADAFPFHPRPNDYMDIFIDLESLLCVNGTWNEASAHETIRALRSFSLITASSFTDMVFLHLHPLVQAWARDMFPTNSQHYKQMVTQLLSSCSNPESYQLYRHIFPHVLNLIEGDDEDGLHVNEEVAFAAVLKDRAFYDKAEKLFKKAFAVLSENGEKIDDNALLLGATLALTYKEHGRWNEAEKLESELLEQSKTHLGKDHATTLRLIRNLATTYAEQGRWSEAKILSLDVLEQCRTLLGKSHPENIAAAATLATIYQSLGLYNEAEDLEVDVLAQRRTMEGEDHPDTILAAGNLAATYKLQCRYDEAEKLALGVLEKRRRLYGKDHLHTLLAARDLASIYRLQRRLNDAEELSLEVLEQSSRMLGAEHPDTLTIASNLSIVHSDQQRWEEAEKLGLEVLECRKRRIGKEHPDTITTMANLAMNYIGQGAFENARDVMSQAVELSLRVLGRQNFHTVTRIAILAQVLRKLDDACGAQETDDLLSSVEMNGLIPSILPQIRE